MSSAVLGMLVIVSVMMFVMVLLYADSSSFPGVALVGSCVLSLAHHQAGSSLPTSCRRPL